MAAASRIQLLIQDGITVARLLDRRIIDESTVREVGEQFMTLLTLANGPASLIIDFNGVDQVSSALLGKLIQLQRRVEASKGRLVLCDLGKTIIDVFRTTNLETIFTITRDRHAAQELFELPAS